MTTNRLLERYHFGPLGPITILLEPRVAGEAEILAVDQASLAESEAQPDLQRTENQTLVPDTDTAAERSEEIVPERVGRPTDQTEIGEPEKGDAET